MAQRVMVAMSGGVDSSVAALLMQRAGYEVVGMTAELFGDASAAGPCCGKAGISAACTVCAHLGIEHRQVNMSGEFERQVIGRFLDGYEQGRTPNPCSDCNRFIKFDLFVRLADEWGCDLIATGHYARIVEEAALRGRAAVPGRHAAGAEARSPDAAFLAPGIDNSKDQSYFLACIAPELLPRIRFPLGELTKLEVRRLAAEAQLPTAQRKESQDICFMHNGVGIGQLMEWHRGRTPARGDVVDEAGRVLTQHEGIENYTIGQRRGLGLGGGTEGLVIHRLDAASNTVVVAPRSAHPVTGLRLSDFTDMAPGRWTPAVSEVMVRGRYRQELWPARVCLCSGGALVVPQAEVFSMAAGQWCVGYDGDTVLFGGIIEEVLHEG